ncbi:hypothetical protein DPMN_013979 [Dreissena polymorpha]|uniref:Uncharacterized protein n=1 Tax=Dreissena polymorpha TaxID=45954 RepID=A0A9D4N563_DREPO|nr:hypothetical protein DPMN_013979 [Dreissena polymorpha]
MTPDQKLMAHEYVAIFLERAECTNFPTLSRRALLDKYNFVSLEAEGKPTVEEGEAEKMDSNIRYCNFNYLKAIVNGEVEESRVAEGIVRGLELADRWKDTDVITEKLDEANIKIRVGA